MARHSGAVGEDVFDADVGGCVFVLEDEVVSDQAGDWGCPLHVGVFYVVVDKQRHGGGCKSLCSAS